MYREGTVSLGPSVLYGSAISEVLLPASKLPKLTFSTREVATMLGVSRPTVDRLVADGHLPSVDLGPTRRTLIPAWVIEELVARPEADRTAGRQRD